MRCPVRGCGFEPRVLRFDPFLTNGFFCFLDAFIAYRAVFILLLLLLLLLLSLLFLFSLLARGVASRSGEEAGAFGGDQGLSGVIRLSFNDLFLENFTSFSCAQKRTDNIRLRGAARKNGERIGRFASRRAPLEKTTVRRKITAVFFMLDVSAIRARDAARFPDVDRQTP